jgi:hypothetical protein
MVITIREEEGKGGGRGEADRRTNPMGKPYFLKPSLALGLESMRSVRADHFSSCSHRQHKVPLVDEYDLIMRDLKPFQAYAPHVLREEIKSMTGWEGTYVLSVRGGKADASR